MKPLLLVCGLCLGGAVGVEGVPVMGQNKPAVARTKADFFTPARLEELSLSHREAWGSYLQRSREMADFERGKLTGERQTGETLKAPGGKDFKIKSDWPDEWYKTLEAARLAEAMMSFQSPSGGWSKAVDYARGARTKGMAWTSQSNSFHYTATFDNRSTTEQLVFLNRLYAATGRSDVRTAIEHGLNYIFVAQYPNGGWPQTFPLEGSYHDAITFNDNAITHILELMQAIVTAEPQWKWLDNDTRRKASAALEQGLSCIFAAQVERNGVKTGWCAQYDPLDLKPVAARIKEPASLSGGESVGIVRLLMAQPSSSPEIMASVNGALAWFEKVRMTEVNGSAKWARFYDVQTDTPLFAGADDGILYPTFEAMKANNRVGYDYFVTIPQKLLETDAPKWRARWEKRSWQ